MKTAGDTPAPGLGAVLEESVAPSKQLNPAPSAVVNLAKNIDRIQEQHVIYSSKMDTEERKGLMLDAKIKAAEGRIRTLYNSTRGGAVIVDDSARYKKRIAKLEKSLQTLRIQLSKSHTENLNIKAKITDARTDKLLYLQIHKDMVGNSLNHSIIYVQNISYRVVL
jgi:hypothetical protein